MEEFNIKICNIESQNNDAIKEEENVPVELNETIDISNDTIYEINEITPDIEPINTIKKLGRKISSLNKSPKYQLSIYNHIKRRYVVIGSYPSFAVISKQLSEHDIIMTASILQNIYSGKKLQKLVLIQKI
jgi:hypothetical protein